MCLDVTKKNGKPYKAKPVAKTATKAITVYKILLGGLKSKTLKSQVQSFKYTLGKLYTTEMVLDYNKDYPEDGGSIYEGFHSFAEIPNSQGNGTVIVKCIIPKGAKYYTKHSGGKLNQRASNKIKLVKILS